MMYVVAFIPIFIGIVASIFIILLDNFDIRYGDVVLTPHHQYLYGLLSKEGWRTFLVYFAKGFTFFGLLVLLAVRSWHYGKAMMDQAERLRERRHALRQGRLFVHLKDGELTIDELKKVFTWNVSNGNAFANIPTEASAPWGGIFKDALTYLAGILPKPKPPSLP